MTTGNWNNQDGLALQFGTSKALPDWSGEYNILGSTREIEFLIPLVPVTMGGYQIPAIPTSFTGTSTYAAAGISNPDLFIPLQTTAIQTASSTALTVSKPQLFIEMVQLTALTGMVGGTSFSVGLAAMGTNQQFVQIAPNSATQIVNAVVTATLTSPGMTATWWQPGTSTYSVPTTVAGGGSWIGQVPLVTNTNCFGNSGVNSNLPSQAWISATASGVFTDGLIKCKMRYTTYGSINQ